MAIWDDTWDTSAFTGDIVAPGTSGGFNQGQDLIGPSGQPTLPPDFVAPPDRTWGQQVGDWLGISDSTQGKIAAASKELKGTLGDLKNIQRLADPMAPKAGQVAPAGGQPPSQMRAAQSLDELLQQLYQRRQALSQL